MNKRSVWTVVIAAGVIGLATYGVLARRAGKPAAPAAPAELPYPRSTVIDSYALGATRVDVVRVQTNPHDDSFYVKQGEKVVLEAPGRVIGVVGTFPSREQPRFLLVEMSHAGNTCPLMYRVIDLRGESPQVTRADFGTCWRVKGSPAETDGTLDFEFFGDRSGETTATFRVKDGEATRLAKGKAPAKPAAPAKAAVKGPAAPAR
jgi:hypothetical protein